jgi:hypothetical protein
MVSALLSMFLAAECLAAVPLRLPELDGAIPPDLSAAFAPQASAAAVSSVAGAPLDLSIFGMTIGPALPARNPPPMRGNQAVRVDLPSLLNRHIKGSGFLDAGGDKFYLSTQVDLKGEVFLSVQGQDWVEPNFFHIDSGLQARWRSADGGAFTASIDGSIFRWKFNNRLVIQDEGAGRQVFSRTLSDFFYSAYRQGEPAVIGGNTYRVFLSHVVDRSRSPAVFDKSAYGVCLLYDESEDPGYHDIQPYPLPLAAVQGGQPAAFRFHDGQVLYFRLADEGRTLVISD